MDVIAPVSHLFQIDAFTLVVELVMSRICQNLAAPAGHPLPARARLLPFSVMAERSSA